MTRGLKEVMICDFCSHDIDNTDWTTYMSEPFERETKIGTVKVTAHFSRDWLACGACSKLIDALDRKGLLARSFGGFKASYGFEVSEDSSIQGIQDAFWAGFQGKEG